MSLNFKDLSYDCIVHFVKYVGATRPDELYDPDFYYEVFRGLQSVNTSFNLDAIGTASITIVLPTTYPRPTPEEGRIPITGYDDKVLLRRKKVTNANIQVETETQDVQSYSTKKKYESLSVMVDDLLQDEKFVDEFNYSTDPVDVAKLFSSIRNNNPSNKISGTIRRNTKIKININTPLTYQDVYVNDGENNGEALNDNVNPFGEAVKYYPLLDYTRTQCFFKPMDKVRIYMSNRYQDDKHDMSYNKVFEGLISSISVNYGNGQFKITIQCEDLLKWMKISYFSVNPATDQETFKNLAGGTQRNITPFTSNLAGQDPGKIIEALTVGTTFDQVEISVKDYRKLYNNTSTNYKDKLERKLRLSDGTITDKDARGTLISNNPDEIIENRQPGSTIVYYQTGVSVKGCGFLTLSRKNIKGVDPKVADIEQQTDFSNEILFIDPNLDSYAPFLKQFKGSYELWDHDYKARYDICKEICNIMETEFYADPDGIINFKPPYYNFNPGLLYRVGVPEEGKEDKTENYQVLNGDQYVILDLDILSANFTEDDQNIVNVFYVTGQEQFIGNIGVMQANTTIEFDERLARQFGLRIDRKEMPFLGTADDEEQRLLYAQAFMNRRNSKYKKGTAQIFLRPELHLGRTIVLLGDSDTDILMGQKPEDFNPTNSQQSFLCRRIDDSVRLLNGTPSYNSNAAYGKIPDNKTIVDRLSNIMVYYISGLGHNWNAGGNCTTSLTLTHGRYWDKLFGLLKFFKDTPFHTSFTDDFIEAGETAIKNYEKGASDLNEQIEQDFADVQGLNSEDDVYISVTQDEKIKGKEAEIQKLNDRRIARDELAQEKLDLEARSITIKVILDIYLKNNRAVFPTFAEVYAIVDALTPRLPKPTVAKLVNEELEFMHDFFEPQASTTITG